MRSTSAVPRWRSPIRGRRGRHRRQLGRVGHQLGELGDQSIGCEVALFDQHSAMMVAELAGVVDLVVLGGAGPRHEDGRHADGGELGDRRCAGSRHHQIGCGIHQRHAVLVSKHSIHDAVGCHRERARHRADCVRRRRGRWPDRAGRQAARPACETTSFSRLAPSEPPTTANTNRSCGRPSCERAVLRDRGRDRCATLLGQPVRR